ncbi:hypothetical protein AC477_01125 [miscellaneous Crenarchaeota group-1 archaeon SG8-32-1]|uniref:Uncharacterized protein n=1 Tax=miscellaneous Crenarchaeota group-1 archaeon SG8-32-1 TaxID=1685124 RepID=A0A0M0BYW5_9ARCH|nr:MAG: hypothetical protein AC477_01125 [miscellaneous Crenarchaeota group-1 archaeon SG8-32-1]
MSAKDIKFITQSIESLSKRLRRVEVLARLSTDTGLTQFLELDDTPSTYENAQRWAVLVNSDEDGLEFGPVGGDACVTFVCGSPGWRASGGSPVRTLVHETAFQLTSAGDPRGANAIDLQQTQFDPTYVAAAEDSAILSNLRNKIESDCDLSIIIGAYNDIIDNSVEGGILGWSNTIDNSTGNVICGILCMLDTDSWGNFVSGYNNDISWGNGSAMFNEGNDLVYLGTQDPWYDFQAGILNEMQGDCFVCYQWGEDNLMIGIGGSGTQTTLWDAQIGFDNFLGNVTMNVGIGQGTFSWRPSGHDEYYTGRLLWSGDYPQKWPTTTFGASHPANNGASGYNQLSWFSQNVIITDWPVTWTTSRFEFPIINDSAWGFVAYIAGTEQGCANTYHWKIEGMVENDGGTTAILYSIVTNLYRDVVTKEWQVVADNVNDRLVFQYRDTGGPDSTDCNIQFDMNTQEVGWEA